MIGSGYSRLSEIRGDLNINEKSFGKHILEMIEKGWIVVDEDNSNIVRLTVSGYNIYSPRSKRLSRTKKKIEPKPGSPLARRESKLAKTPKNTPQQKLIQTQPKPKIEEIKEETSPFKIVNPLITGATKLPPSFFVKRWEEIKKKQKIKEKTSIKESLFDKLKKHNIVASASSFPKMKKNRPKRPQQVCALCKQPFTPLSPDGKGNPVFGYCFCGAAYHKDCYLALLETNDGRCVNCGRKLVMVLDKNTEKQLKNIKNLF